jgi:hypothetical protein
VALALIACCLLLPALIGAAWLLAVGTVVEAALLTAVLAFGALALRRRRCGAKTGDARGRG